MTFSLSMHYLMFNIICTFLIFLLFKISRNSRGNLTNIITLNYIFASLTGIIFTLRSSIPFTSVPKDWWPVTLVIGVAFVGGFYLIGRCTALAGIAVTTVAGKMSVILPVSFSIIYYSEHMHWIKWVALSMALVAVFLSVFKNEQKRTSVVWLPFFLFIFLGITDLSLKFSQEEFVSSANASLFTVMIFISSSLAGCIVYLMKRNWRCAFSLRDLLTGLSLGVVNYMSIFFIFMALESGCFESSVVFTISNSGVIIFSVLSGRLIFKEKLTFFNYMGIFLSVISVAVLFNVQALISFI